MSQLDLFLPLLATTDTKKKLSISSDIINYLDQADNSIECEDIGGFVDGVIPWMNQSNFRVSQTGVLVKWSGDVGVIVVQYTMMHDT